MYSTVTANQYDPISLVVGALIWVAFSIFIYHQFQKFRARQAKRRKEYMEWRYGYGRINISGPRNNAWPPPPVDNPIPRK